MELINYRLLIILLFFVFLFFFQKESKAVVISFKGFILRLCSILFFFFYFFVYFRVLNLFRIRQELDLKFLLNFIMNNYNVTTIFLVIIIFFFIKRVLFFFFKRNFLRVHYYIVSYDFKNISYRLHKIYIRIIYSMATWPNKFNIATKKRIKLFFFFKYFFVIVMLIIFLVDLYNNDFKLTYSLEILPYFGLYQFCYLCNVFMVYYMDEKKDILVSRILYEHDVYTTNVEVFAAMDYVNFILKQ